MSARVAVRMCVAFAASVCLGRAFGDITRAFAHDLARWVYEPPRARDPEPAPPPPPARVVGYLHQRADGRCPAKGCDIRYPHIHPVNPDEFITELDLRDLKFQQTDQEGNADD